MLDELVSKIDAEIARSKQRGKTTWFDINVDVSGIAVKLYSYYRERGYMIEVRPCKACLGERADIIISW